MKYPILLMFSLLSCGVCAQGFTDGFKKKKGEGSLALTGSYESADTYFFGDLEQPTDLTIRTLSAYISYGLSDQFDLIASVPYMQTDTLNRGLQDGIFAFKYQNGLRQYTHGRMRTLTMVGFQFPLSRYPTQTAMPIGIGSTSFLFRLLSQYESHNGFFIHFQSGFDFRVLPTQQFGMPFILRTGYGNASFYFDLWLDYFHSFDRTADQTVFGGGGSRWWKTGGTIYFPIGRQFGLFTGGAYILTGRNIAQSWRINVGAVWNWN